MKIGSTLSLFLLVAATAHAQPVPPTLGVPFDLAVHRAATISNLHYDLSLTIPKALDAPVTGTTRITFDLRDNSSPLVIDFETSRDHVRWVKTGDAVVLFEYVNGHIVLPATVLKAGRNVVEIAFDAGNEPLNRSADFLYALFVPARARQAIPVFDQPDLKARWKLHLTYPAEWRAVSNGAEEPADISASDIAPGGPEMMPSNARSNSTAVMRFSETEPLPTYLFSFVVGDFKVETARRNGRTLRMFHRETDAAKVARNNESIFDLHAAALDFMEEYTGIPYAFGKFDFVLIPAFQFNGMEHAGKILYNAANLLLEDSATQDDRLARAQVIAHETAHMWFGDLVTMRWFDEVWLKEVFANFMAAKMVNPSFPQVNHELRFLFSHYPGAYEVDRTGGANPIQQRLDNLNEAGSLYGAIIYQKAPVVMRHLEALLGAESFRDGLREYLRAHRFANATWNDLIAVLGRRAPTDLRAWSRVWVEQPGRPVVTTVLEVRSGRITRLAFTQRDAWKRGTRWPQELRVVIGYPEATRLLRVPMTSDRVEVKAAVGLPAPSYVLPAGEGWAYGDFELDKGSLAYLLQALPSIADPVTRGAAWVTLWDALLDGAMTPGEFLDLTASALPKETDEQLTSRVLRYARRVWWRFLLQSERIERAAALEQLLRDGLTKAGSVSEKAAWFRTLQNVALTPETVAWLRGVWAQTEALPGLPLAETDYTALALDLAVREVDGWKEILVEQLRRIDNPDRKARFAFVTPAVSADPSAREAWFRSLKDVKNRRRETWVTEGLAYLHHPLRAGPAIGYLAPSLDMLWEILKTGDIFFPKNWLDATLAGHSSPKAVTVVRQFLASLPPNYPERLKNITLQSADELFRAAAQQSRIQAAGHTDRAHQLLGRQERN